MNPLDDIPVSMRFCANLRKLVALCPSTAEAARSLDINRAQFNRYLNGEAHPKPAVLKRISDFFGVDARILTEVLPDGFIAGLPAPGSVRPPPPRNFGLENAVHFLPEHVSHYVSPEELPDGLYLYWRASMGMADSFVCSALQMKTLPGARVLRGYVNRSSILQTDVLPPKLRELRGWLLGVEDGYAWFFASAPAWNNVALNFTSRPAHRFSTYLPGYFALARNETVAGHRIGRCVMERLPRKRASIMRAAHATRYYKAEELPEGIRHELMKPLA